MYYFHVYYNYRISHHIAVDMTRLSEVSLSKVFVFLVYTRQRYFCVCCTGRHVGTSRLVASRFNKSFFLESRLSLFLEKSICVASLNLNF